MQQERGHKKHHNFRSGAERKRPLVKDELKGTQNKRKCSSVTKYGMQLPAHEDVLEEKKKFDAHKLLLQRILKCEEGITNNNHYNFRSRTERKTSSTVTDKEEVKKPPTKRKCSSFTKYGMHLPTSDKVLQEKKKLDEHKQLLQRMFQCAVPETRKSFQLEEKPNTNISMLDCTHLTSDELMESFTNNLEYVRDIFTGSRYCKRHEQFERAKRATKQFSKDDLKYNSSMAVFLYSQLELLLQHLHKNFDNGDFSEYLQYYFKVLLPELCLKIFMDVHNMQYESAFNYLENRPAI